MEFGLRCKSEFAKRTEHPNFNERMTISMDDKNKKKNALTPEEKSPFEKPSDKTAKGDKLEREKDDFFDAKFDDIEEEYEATENEDFDAEKESDEDEEPVTLDDIDEEALKNFDINKLLLDDDGEPVKSTETDD